MRPASLFRAAAALLLAALFGPARGFAAGPRELPAFDAPLAAPAGAPAVPALPALDASLSAPLPATLSALPQAAAVPAAAPAAPVAVALPGVSSAFQETVAQLERTLAAPGAAPAQADHAVSLGSALFDRAGAVETIELPVEPLAEPGAPAAGVFESVLAAADRRFPGVFIQQEQEGNLHAVDPRDSSGDFFLYYRPTSLKPALLESARARMGWWDRFVYWIKTFGGRLARKDPAAVWRALPQAGKVLYLALLTQETEAQHGHDAAWEGKNYLLLEKGPGAPDYVARHPAMESPPRMRQGPATNAFLLPEIVTAKDKPAATVSEALGRTRRIIAETGHAGTQYHAFMKLEPAKLLGQLARIESAVQVLNDRLFFDALVESPENLLHAVLQPWHRGRTRRIARLMKEAFPAPHPFRRGDFDSEKLAFVGFRWWGMEDGKAVVSLELRGARLPWKGRRTGGAGRGFEETPPPAERDYGPIEQDLKSLVLIADAITQGTLPPPQTRSPELDLALIQGLFDARARLREFPADATLTLEELAARLGEGTGPLPALLFPFAAAEPPFELMDEVLDLSARLKAHPDGAADRSVRYELWTAYAQWAGRPRLLAHRRFSALVAALGR